MELKFEDEEQYLRFFRLIEASVVDSDDHELIMLYSTMKHEIDKRREFAQAAIDRKLKNIQDMQAQIEADRLNIIELETEKARWELKEHTNE